MKNYSIPTDREIADHAYNLIVADLSIYDSIPSLATKVGTNPVTLKLLFRKYHGVGLFDFSRAIRLEKAKVLLTDTNYTLATIADMVGYSEGSNFQIAFKTVVGEPPGAWRKKHQLL